MNYIFYGELLPTIRKNLKSLLVKILGEPDDFNNVKLDYEECKLSEIIEEASTLPLGYDKKVVVIDNAKFIETGGDDTNVEYILNLLKNSNDEIYLIFVLKSSKLNKKSPIVKWMEENGKLFEFLNIKDEEWPTYIKEYFKKRDVIIEASAVDELKKRVDGDLYKFINEANKLCLYKDHITVADVCLMVSKPLEDDAFQITKALFDGDNSLAISIFRDLKLLGTKFIDALIPLMGAQFRFISEVLFLNNKGLENDEIASELGVSSGRVYMTLKNARRFSRRQIAHALDDLYNLDLQIKSGLIDRSYGLELFLINFPN